MKSKSVDWIEICITQGNGRSPFETKMLHKPTQDKPASTTLIKSWRTIASTIHYDQLSPQRQAEARNEFFLIVLQPQLSGERLRAAKIAFEQAVQQQTRPDTTISNVSERLVPG